MSQMYKYWGESSTNTIQLPTYFCILINTYKMTYFNALKGKCPNCKQGKIFNTNGNPFLFKMPSMRKRCNLCNYKFDLEPGFFFSAMYVSYAIACAQMIVCFIITWVLLDLPILVTFFCVMAIAILSSSLNFRLSRIIWMYMFYKKK